MSIPCPCDVVLMTRNSTGLNFHHGLRSLAFTAEVDALYRYRYRSGIDDEDASDHRQHVPWFCVDHAHITCGAWTAAMSPMRR